MFTIKTTLVFNFIALLFAPATADTPSVQRFTCEALKTISQLNNCCLQSDLMPTPTCENSKQNSKTEISMKHVFQFSSGVAYDSPNLEANLRVRKFYGMPEKVLQGLPTPEKMRLFTPDFQKAQTAVGDMKVLAQINKWANASGIMPGAFGVIQTQTEMLKNCALYPLLFAPGTHHQYTFDSDLALAAIGVAAKKKSIANNGAEYLKKRIFDPCETSLWLKNHQLAAPSDVNEKISEIMVGRVGNVPATNAIPRDPNQEYTINKLYWAQDVPNDGYVVGDRMDYHATTKTNATIDYLAGSGGDGAVGTLQDYAQIIKMVLRGGLHKKRNGAMVTVLSREALEYALTPVLKPHYPGDDDEEFFFGALASLLPHKSYNFNGGAYTQDFNNKRLERGQHSFSGSFGTSFCFDMGTQEYAVQAQSQIPRGVSDSIVSPNACELLGMDRVAIQNLFDAYIPTPGMAAIVGKLDSHEFFVGHGVMQKGKRTRSDHYYRFGGQTKFLGRLAIAKAVVDERLIYDSEPLAKFIVEYANVSVYKA